MNDKMLDIIGLADEKYLREAEGTSQIKVKHKRRISAKFAAVAAAAAIMTVTAGAVAVTKLSNKESVGEFYDSSAVSKMEERGFANGAVSENSHFSVTLETVLKDDYKLMPIVTIKPLDEQAEDYLAQSGEMQCPITYYSDTDECVRSCVTCFAQDQYKKGDGKLSMRMEIPFVSLHNSIDKDRPLTIRLFEMKYASIDGKTNEASLFNGIELKLDDHKEVKSTKLYSEKGNELYLSEIGFVALIPYPDNGSFWNGDLVYKDGKKDKVDDISSDGQGLGLGEKQNIGLSLNFKTLIDVDNVESIELMGETYTRK